VSEDPFGTAQVRERVLAAWSASPERFREDANSEEDLALGGYRDRVLVELAQNAADAAARAGVPGRLLLRLVEGPEPVLVAANTGARLDDAGVRALATLRASAKRDGAATGRFGVGFSAVLALSDEPAVVSHGQGVRFSRAQTRVDVRASSSTGLAEELRRRDEHVPVLRLPYPAEGSAPPGYDTAVLLPLRDGGALELARRLLDGLDDSLLVALPGLTEVVVERPGARSRVLSDVHQRWHVLRRNGSHAPQVLSDRPTEERARPGWSLAWAVPRDRSAAVPATVHAPTPTDEPLGWPALLVADLPLDPDRRHVVAGPAAEAVLDAAALAYADLLEELARDATVLDLVPTTLPGGWVAGRLREAVLAALPVARVLPAADTSVDPLRPRDAVALTGPGAHDPAVVGVLAPVVDGLVAAGPGAEPVLRVLDVRRTTLADVVEQWPDAGTPDDQAALHRALLPAAADPAVREALAALPVPLADGRVVRGVRGLVLPDAGVPPQVLETLAEHGLRAVHPALAADAAASELLERLGAQAVSASQLLDHPALHELVRACVDDPDPTPWVDSVLALVQVALASGAVEPGAHAFLGELPLPDDDGDLAPASVLVQPGSAAADLLDPDAVGLVDDELVRRWGADVLRAVGVADRPLLVRAGEVDPLDLPPGLDDLDEADRWVRAVAGSDAGAVVEGPVLAVRDLDLVDPDRRPDLLSALASDPELRAALVRDVVVRSPRGSRRAPSYTSWWLRRHAGLAGLRPAGTPGDAVVPEGPAWTADLPRDVAAAVGMVRAVAELDPAGRADLLRRLGGQATADVATLLATWAALTADDPAGGDPDELDLGERTWALDPHGRPVRCSVDEPVVLDDARWWQRADLGPRVVPAPGRAERLADLLDLDLASDRAAGEVTSTGASAPVPPAVLSRWPRLPAAWWEHDDLRVDGVEVDWWVEQEPGGAPVLHAATADGLARALAHAAGAWASRHLVAQLLDDAGAAAALVEDALG
jgi:hypothetical protein